MGSSLGPHPLVAITFAGLLLLTGCVSLTAAHLPSSVLDVRTGNGWVRNMTGDGWRGPSGGWFQKQAVRSYTDDASDDRGFKGFLQITSIRGVLSPNREELQDRVEKRLKADARSKGLELSEKTFEGTRRLANGALSFYLTFNATQTEQSGPFGEDAGTINIIGEVFRCTGGATVIVTGSAQVEGRSSVGGIQTSYEYEPRTWKEIVQDPQGTIGGFQGSKGLIYNIACGG